MREPDDKELEEFWRHPALQALPPEERARLAGQLRLLRLEPDQVLFADEQTASHTYLRNGGGDKASSAARPRWEKPGGAATPGRMGRPRCTRCRWRRC
ncbi:hypothetical protein DK842_01950 [Chromobacterium phragmitis]|uniref:hypothetical protein n=1 Tax=Chromobacterium phragmitis TaxID=2202141 RepID=UPI000DECA227|nr:hypothetical protein [Chromobacterium phragmitis]AXE28787.1 hypothetical protein DK842_01950 [Chromobacterium phragmitis]